MTWTPVSELVLLWWNTSLSPPAPRHMARASSDDIAFVISELKALFSARPFQLAGLCEVSEDNAKRIVEALDAARFSYHYQAALPGNARVDVAIIYDADQLEFLDSEAWIDSFGRRATMKTAEMICLNVRAIKQMITRDRSLAQKFPGYLYNPSWRNLGESLPFLADSVVGSTSGTCYYPGDNHRQWASFDQMIFSPTFIKSSAMVLDEQHSKILATPALRDKITSRSISTTIR